MASSQTGITSLAWLLLLLICAPLNIGCQSGLQTESHSSRRLDEILQETMRLGEQKQQDALIESQRGHQLLASSDSDSLQSGRPIATSLELTGPIVSEIFEETDVREAIQSLASQAKISVIIDEQVSGVVTALIEDVPFEQALEQLLLPLGFIWKQRGEQYLIGSTDPNSALFRHLSSKFDFHPKFFSPDDLVPLLPESLAQYVRIVGKRNLIVVHAPEDIAQQIIRELENADQPQAQVMLEAIVTVQSPETSYQFGFDIRQILTTQRNQELASGISGLAFTGILTPGAISELFGNFGLTSYFLRCLEEAGYLEITAAPRVMAKNGEKAQISINRETFFSTQPANRDVFFRQDIQKVEAGIVLEITPVIRGDVVTVVIERAEVSEDIRESGSDPDLANPFPLINRRFVTTTVDVRDGETITIGGLTHRQLIDRENRVPWLSSLPGVGKLFRQIDKQNQEAEVTVFISPRIVYPDRSAHETIDCDLVPAGLLPQCPDLEFTTSQRFDIATPILP